MLRGKRKGELLDEGKVTEDVHGSIWRSHILGGKKKKKAVRYFFRSLRTSGVDGDQIL